MSKVQFDLKERTARFGEAAIDLCVRLPRNGVTFPLISQFVRSATGIGANYAEADEAESKADFRHKIAICRKEAGEAGYWCRMLSQALPSEKAAILVISAEARALHLIFCRIVLSTDANLRAEKQAHRSH